MALMENVDELVIDEVAERIRASQAKMVCKTGVDLSEGWEAGTSQGTRARDELGFVLHQVMVLTSWKQTQIGCYHPVDKDDEAINQEADDIPGTEHSENRKGADMGEATTRVHCD